MFFAQMGHWSGLNCIQCALLALVFTSLNFSNAFHMIRWNNWIIFRVLVRWFYDRIIVTQTIRVGIVLVKCVDATRTLVIVRALNAWHTHGCRRIHSIQTFYGGMRSNVRQKLIGERATVRAFDLMCPYFFIIIVGPKSPFLTENLLVQRFVIEFVSTRQRHMKRIQRIIRY